MQVASCYPDQTKEFASELSDLLDKHYAVLNSSLRQTLVKSLILLRNRNQVPFMSPWQLNYPLLCISYSSPFCKAVISNRNVLAGHSIASTTPLLQALQVPRQKSSSACIQAYHLRYICLLANLEKRSLYALLCITIVTSNSKEQFLPRLQNCWLEHNILASSQTSKLPTRSIKTTASTEQSRTSCMEPWRIPMKLLPRSRWLSSLSCGSVKSGEMPGLSMSLVSCILRTLWQMLEAILCNLQCDMCYSVPQNQVICQERGH